MLKSSLVKGKEPEGEAQGYSALSRVPLGRIGEPREIAAAASFLASEDAAYVTGSTIDVNGGLRMQ
jgi:NAD(P)-dependent dehydrogenase (short-subunit alcohol dehydrogenase family)